MSIGRTSYHGHHTGVWRSLRQHLALHVPLDTGQGAAMGCDTIPCYITCN